jgi:hypothetical protein
MNLHPTFERLTMNTTQLIASSFLVFAGGAALASEASEAPVPQSTLTRAEVRAELARAMANGELLSGAAAEQHPFGMRRPAFANIEAQGRQASTRSREEVRAEARAAVRTGTFNPDYPGG